MVYKRLQLAPHPSSPRHHISRNTYRKFNQPPNMEESASLPASPSSSSRRTTRTSPWEWELVSLYPFVFCSLLLLFNPPALRKESHNVVHGFESARYWGYVLLFCPFCAVLCCALGSARFKRNIRENMGGQWRSMSLSKLLESETWWEGGSKDVNDWRMWWAVFFRK